MKEFNKDTKNAIYFYPNTTINYRTYIFLLMIVKKWMMKDKNTYMWKSFLRFR
jgi:hypothetical protein